MKVGIIRCMQTEDYCPGTTDFRMIKEKKRAFENVNEDIEIIGFCNCGGCPAKKSVLRARELVRRGGRHNCVCIVYSKRHSIRLPMPIRKKNEKLNQTRSTRKHLFFRLYTLSLFL